MRSLLLSLSFGLLLSPAFAQDAVPQRQYKLQQPNLASQIRQLQPIAPITQTSANNPWKNLVLGQIAACWQRGASTALRDEGTPLMEFTAAYNRDGGYETISLSKATTQRYLQDEPYRNVAKSITDAVEQCSPLKNMPAASYDAWQSIFFTYDDLRRITQTH